MAIDVPDELIGAPTQETPPPTAYHQETQSLDDLTKEVDTPEVDFDQLIDLTEELPEPELKPQHKMPEAAPGRSSKVYWDFIRKRENDKDPELLTQGIWPGGSSGPTVGWGFDAGKRTELEMIRDGVDPDLANYLGMFYGKTGQDAKEAAEGLQLTKPELEHLTQVYEAKFEKDVPKEFLKITGKSFYSLDPAAQTVLMSLAYNHGSLASIMRERKDENGKAYRPPSKIVAQLAAGDTFAAIENLRTWKGKDKRLLGRRKLEAELLAGEFYSEREADDDIIDPSAILEPMTPEIKEMYTRIEKELGVPVDSLRQDAPLAKELTEQLMWKDIGHSEVASALVKDPKHLPAVKQNIADITKLEKTAKSTAAAMSDNEEGFAEHWARTMGYASFKALGKIGGMAEFFASLVRAPEKALKHTLEQSAEGKTLLKEFYDVKNNTVFGSAMKALIEGRDAILDTSVNFVVKSGKGYDLAADAVKGKTKHGMPEDIAVASIDLASQIVSGKIVGTAGQVLIMGGQGFKQMQQIIKKTTDKMKPEDRPDQLHQDFAALLAGVSIGAIEKTGLDILVKYIPSVAKSFLMKTLLGVADEAVVQEILTNVANAAIVMQLIDKKETFENAKIMPSVKEMLTTAGAVALVGGALHVKLNAKQWTADAIESKAGQAVGKFVDDTTGAIPIPHFVKSYYEAFRPNKAHKAAILDAQLTEMHNTVNRVAAVDKETAIALGTETLAQQGIHSVQVEAQAVQDWAEQQEDPSQILEDLGIADQMAEVLAKGGTLRIEGAQFASGMLLHPNFSDIQKHVQLHDTIPPVEVAGRGYHENQAEALAAMEADETLVEEGYRDRVKAMLAQFKDGVPVDADAIIAKTHRTVINVVDDLIAKVQADKAAMDDVVKEARLAALDTQQRLNEEALATAYENLEGRETAGKPTKAAQAHIDRLLKKQEALDSRQRFLEIPDRVAALRPEFDAPPTKAKPVETLPNGSAAVRINGKVYTGQLHTDAIEAAIADGIDPDAAWNIPEIDQQFVTNLGRWVNRKEAMAIIEALDPNAEIRNAFDWGLMAEELGLINEGIAAKAEPTPPNPAPKPSDKVETTAGKLERLNVKSTRTAVAAVRRAAREATRIAKSDMAGAQKILKKMLKSSGMDVADQAKFDLTSIKTYEQLIRKLPRIQERAVNLIEGRKVKSLSKAVKSVVNNWKPRISGEKQVSNGLDVDTQAIFTQLQGDLKLSKLEAEDAFFKMQMEHVQTISNENPDGTPVDSLTQLRLQVLAVQAQSESVDSTSLQEALIQLDDLVKHGKAVTKTRLALIKEVSDQKRDRLLETLPDTQHHDKNLAQRFAQGMEEAVILTPTMAWSEKLTKIMSTSDSTKYEQVLADLDIFDASFQHAAAKEYRSIRFIEMAAEAMGVDPSKVFGQMMDDSRTKIRLGGKGTKYHHADHVDKEGNVITSGKDSTIIMTKGEMRQLAMEMSEPDLWNQMQNPEAEGYTLEIRQAIEQELNNPVDQALMDGMKKMYSEYYPDINEVYKRIYGINLNRTLNFVPVSYEYSAKEKDQDQFLRNFHFRGSMVPGSLKQRKGSSLKRKIRSDYETFRNYSNEMEYFMAFGEKTRELNQVFNSKTIDKIREGWGEGMANQIKEHLFHFSNKGAQGSASSDALIRVGMRNFGVGTLALKPLIMVKQFASAVAYAQHVSAADYAVGVAKFIADPQVAIEMLRDSPYYNMRGNHIDIDMSAITSSQAGGRIYNFMGNHPKLADLQMINVKFGDKVSLSVGGYGFIHAAMTSGYKGSPPLSKAEALQLYSKITNQTQQTNYMEEQSEWQANVHWGYKALAMFQSSGAAIVRQEYKSFINRKRGRITKKQFAKDMILLHVMVPQFIQLVSNLGEWDWGDQGRAMVLGSFNNLIVAGQAFAAGAVAFQNLFVDDEDESRLAKNTLRNPYDQFMHIYEVLAADDWSELTSLESLIEGNKAAKAIALAVQGLTGIAAPSILRGAEGAAALLTDGDDGARTADEQGEAMMKLLLISDFAIKAKREREEE